MLIPASAFDVIGTTTDFSLPYHQHQSTHYLHQSQQSLIPIFQQQQRHNPEQIYRDKKNNLTAENVKFLRQLGYTVLKKWI